jgi:hypothetical protein
MPPRIDDLSMDDVIEILAFALGEPPAPPPGCSNMLLGLISQLNHLINESQGMFPEHGWINTHIIHFLSAPRLMAHLRDFKDTAETCRCKKSAFLSARAPWALHGRSTAPDKTLARFVDLVSGDVSFVLGLAKLPALYRMKKTEWWPQSRRDLLVGNLNESFIALTAWFYLPDPVPMQGHASLVRPIIQMYKSSVLLGLLKSPAIMNWIHQCGHIAYSRANSSSPVKVSQMTTKNTVALVKDSGDLLRAVNDVLFEEELLLWATSDGRTSSEVFNRTCDLATAASHIAAVRAEEHGLEIPDEVDAAVHSGVDGWTAFAARLMHTDPPSIPKHMTQTMRMALADRQDRAEDPYYRLLDTAFGPQWAHRCHAPECLNTYVSKNRKFQFCSGCESAAYCSHTCQKKAWGHKTAPHRKVCAVSRQVKDVLREYGNEDMQCKILLRIVSETRAELACERFDALRAAKFGYLRKHSLCSMSGRYLKSDDIGKQLNAFEIDVDDPWSNEKTSRQRTAIM